MQTLTLALVVAVVTTNPASKYRGARIYTQSGGRSVQLSSPVYSPDGRTVAFIRIIGHSSDDDPPPTAVVLRNLKTGQQRTVLRPGATATIPTGFDEFSARSVTFSPDGRRLYVEAACSCTSDEIYEVRVATGKARFLVWGTGVSVISNGRWRGDLLMGVHTCHSHPGCDYPVHVVRPNGKTIFVIPRSGGANHQQIVAKWLRYHHWRAW